MWSSTISITVNFNVTETQTFPLTPEKSTDLWLTFLAFPLLPHFVSLYSWTVETERGWGGGGCSRVDGWRWGNKHPGKTLHCTHSVKTNDVFSCLRLHRYLACRILQYYYFTTDIPHSGETQFNLLHWIGSWPDPNRVVDVTSIVSSDSSLILSICRFYEHVLTSTQERWDKSENCHLQCEDTGLFQSGRYSTLTHD